MTREDALKLFVQHLLQMCQLHGEEFEGFGGVEGHILGIHEDTSQTLAAECWIDGLCHYAHQAYHRQWDVLNFTSVPSHLLINCTNRISVTFSGPPISMTWPRARGSPSASTANLATSSAETKLIGSPPDQTPSPCHFSR